MSDLHERFDALVATLEKSLNINLDHVKAPAEPEPVPAAEPDAGPDAAPAA